MTNTKKHWEQVYDGKKPEELGWYQAHPAPSLKLIEKWDLSLKDPIIDIGTGATTLIEELLHLGFENLTALDISQNALELQQARLGEEKAAKVQWVLDDITQPQQLTEHDGFKLWHDRAVFHFMVEEKTRQAYLNTLQQMLLPSGYLVLGTFALSGAEICSGLPVRRYGQDEIAACLGDQFSLIDSFEEQYQQPWGDIKPYCFALFQKNA